MESSQRTHFDGKVREAGNVWIDNFEQQGNVYILTHAHVDHMVGITSQWNHGTILCTHMTADLVRLRYPNLPLRSLDYYEHHCESLPDGKLITLTLIPASHCPGSAMAVLRGEQFGTIVHTGDFRFCPEVAASLRAHVLSHALDQPVSKVITDLTFCQSTATAFPSHDEVVSQMAQVIEREGMGKTIYVESTMLGTERLVMNVAAACGMQCYVSQAMYERLRVIAGEEALDRFTTDPSATQFHCVEHQTFSSALAPKNRNIRRRLDARPVRPIDENIGLYLKPSTQWFRHNSAEIRGKRGPVKRDGVYHFLYSLHSSLTELEDFVKLLRPRSLVPLTAYESRELAKLERWCEISSSGDCPAESAGRSVGEGPLVGSNMEAVNLRIRSPASPSSSPVKLAMLKRKRTQSDLGRSREREHKMARKYRSQGTLQELDSATDDEDAENEGFVARFRKESRRLRFESLMEKISRANAQNCKI